MPFDRVGVVIFAFGAPATISSNRRLAATGHTTALKDNAGIFTQADIQITDPKVPVEYLRGEDPNNPPPTLRIAREAVEWALRKKYNVLKVVAAEPHLKRAARDTMEAVKERDVSIMVISDHTLESYEAWFCPESTQPHTRTKEACRKREELLMALPYFIYKRIPGVS